MEKNQIELEIGKSDQRMKKLGSEMKSVNKIMAELDINQIKREIEEEKIAIKQAVIARENEMLLILRFRYGAKQLGISWYNYRVGEMVKKFKEYQSTDYEVDENKSLEAVMWLAAKEEKIFDEAKIVKAIEKTKVYDPSDRLKMFKCVKYHPVISIAALVVVILIISSVFLFYSYELINDHAALSILMIVIAYAADWWVLYKFKDIWKDR